MTTPDEPTWTEQEIEAKANDLPPYVPPLPGIEPISQDPHLFDAEHEARFGMSLARAAVAGTAAAMIAAAVALLGMGEHPTNHNAVTVEYNQKVARIGDGPWCDMGITVEAIHSGNIDAVCGGPRRGFAYTIAHAQDFKRRGLWTNGLHGITPGCVVFFSWSRGKSIDDIEHVGLVEHVYDDGTVATIECNISDACRREHRDSTYVVGYGRPNYTAQQEDDMPDYVSLSQSKGQDCPAGTESNLIWDSENSDISKAHADGAYPGIFSGGKNGSRYVISVMNTDETHVPAGYFRVIETDPKKNYAQHKHSAKMAMTATNQVITLTGTADPGMHVYAVYCPPAAEHVDLEVHVQKWDK